ncbi:MAG: DUF3179 domain-containing protein [Planctomycetes bacterium]|nr:DUF3179 domain-containing protein [Planctomycetota bacterium]
MPAESARKERLLELRGGGGLLLLAGVMVLVTLAIRVPALLRSIQTPLVGDGSNVDSYGFDFTTCLVLRGPLVASGFSKDHVPALDHPRAITGDEADELNRRLRREQHIKLLVPGDRVAGVRINGVARAYALRLLQWHQIVNDTVGGVPIAVTYDPLCDSAVVFDRRVGDETLAFGHSGLLYNSNLLIYDRRDDPRAESLWSQLQFRAIAGPAAAAGLRLTLVHADVVRWDEWRQRHRDTTIMAPLTEHLKSYKISYSNYYGSNLLRFPVEPLSATAAADPMAAVIALRLDGKWHALGLEHIAERAKGGRRWQTSIGGHSVTFDYQFDPPTVWSAIEPAVDDFLAIRSFRFAWHAMHPESNLATGLSAHKP